MHTRKIDDALSRRPFQPFYVVMSSGDRYAVVHPENVRKLKEGLLVTDHDETSVDDLPDRFTVCSYLHIAALEPTKSRSNGRRRGK